MSSSTQTAIKALAFDKLVAHLVKARNDPRKRERVRVGFALAKIDGWLKEARKEIEDDKAQSG